MEPGGLPDRVTATKKIIADFTAKTGIKVELVAVNEDQFPSLITSSGAPPATCPT